MTAAADPMGPRSGVETGLDAWIHSGSLNPAAP